MKRFFSIWMIILLVSLLFVQNVAAYTLVSGFQPYFSISVGSPYLSEWHNYVKAAVSSWNNVSAPCYVWWDNASNNKIYINSYNDSWYGLASVSWFGLGNTLTIKINSRKIREDATSTRLPYFVQSVAAHEFGHAFGLGDVDPGYYVLMGRKRDRNYVYTPKQDDINGVNAKWR